MKKILLALSTVLVLALAVACSPVDGELMEKSIVYLDFNSNSKGLGYKEYITMDPSKNPFLGMYNETIQGFFDSFGENTDSLKEYIASFFIPNGAQASSIQDEEVEGYCKKIGEKIVFNMAGVAEQDLPMIPGLATVNGNINSFVHENKKNEGKEIGEIYGFSAVLDEIKENSDGYFARYYLHVPGNDKPFYQIDFYYSQKERTFSYRGLMMITMGMEQDNDAIRYFQMNNVKVDSNKKAFKANPDDNNFRVDVFEFMSNGVSKGCGANSPLDGFDIQSWGVAMNFTNDIVASTGLNPKSLVDFANQGFMLFSAYSDIDEALKSIYSKESKNTYSSGKIDYAAGIAETIKENLKIENLNEVHVGLDPDVWTLDTAKKFMKSYYTWEGEYSPFDRDYNSMEEFNNANLKLKIQTGYHEESGIYFPVIYSRKSKTGAILNPKNWVTVIDSEEEPIKDFGKNGFNGGFNLIYKINFYKHFRNLGFTEKQSFESFVITLLKACGLSEAMYYDLYPATLL